MFIIRNPVTCRLISLLGLWIIVACAKPTTTPPKFSEKSIKEQQNDLILSQNEQHFRHIAIATNAHHNIMTTSQTECRDMLAGLTGLALLSAKDFPAKGRKLITHHGIMPRQPLIVAVAENSHAYQAGVRAGDRLISLNNIKPDKNISAWNWLINLEKYLDPSTFSEIVVYRDNQKMSFKFKPQQGCHIPLYVLRNDNSGAYTDGQHIFIHNGLIDLMGKEELVALVLAHETAHILNGHVDKKRVNRTLGSLSGALADISFGASGIYTNNYFSRQLAKLGANYYSHDFEREADYAGLYILARAGYNSKNSAGFWKKLSLHKQTSGFSRTHPSYAERYLLLEKTHKEITIKKKLGFPLTPNRKWQPKKPAFSEGDRV